MLPRQRLLNAFTDNLPDRPPVWIMRQAGRYLPEYRKLKEAYDFLTLVKTPDLATEVTLQPLRRYPQLDAAIIFSDILIIPEAMGLPYAFRETGGIAMERAIRGATDVDALDAGRVREATAYVPAALRKVRAAIGDEKALLGFAGSPWTLGTYMVEGGSSKDFARIRELFAKDRNTFDRLMEKITAAVIQLLLSQIEAGIDALQIFDSWAVATPENAYWDASLKWITRIIETLPEGFPVILFAKGMMESGEALLKTGASGFAVDHGADLAAIRDHLSAPVTLQGNLDPTWMTRSPEDAVTATKELLDRMQPHRRYIFNLGHGITPQARTDTVAAVLETVAAATP